MDDTLELIQDFSNERHMLYRLAGKQRLDPAQQTRLGDLNFQLPMLWDRYRRELAAERRWSPGRTAAFQSPRAA